MKDVAIIIVNWNTKALLRNCLTSIYKETKKYTFDIWVVDNNSPDGSADMVKTEFPHVKLIANKENKGFAPANNQAIKSANAKSLLLLNPDTIVKENAIDKMLGYLFANKETGILTCKLLNGNGSLQKSANNFFSLWSSLFENRFFEEVLSRLNLSGKRFMKFWDHNSIREIDWARGAVLLFTKEVLDKVGLLDEQFYIYAEEMDFYYRVKKAGFKTVFIPDAQIIHFGKSSSRQRRAEMFIQNYKSFYLFLRKHYNNRTYYLYRIRTHIFLFLWLLRYSFEQLFFYKSDKGIEAKTQKSIYLSIIKWHFSKKGILECRAS